LAVGATAVGSLIQTRWRDVGGAKTAVLMPLCAEMNIAFTHEIADPPETPDIVETGLIAYPRHAITEALSGRLSGKRFTLYSIAAYQDSFPRRRFRSAKECKRATLFEWPFEDYEGLTLIVTPPRFPNQPPTGLFAGTQEITLEDPRFHDHFAVYSNDPVIARKVLSPLVIENVKQVLRRHPAGLQLLIRDGLFTAVIEHETPPFGFNAIWSKQLNPTKCRDALKAAVRDCVDMLRIVDLLHLRDIAARADANARLASECVASSAPRTPA